MVIWKFPVLTGVSFILRMPSGATVLDVQMLGERPVMWAEVDPIHPIEERRFFLRGTGVPYSEEEDTFYIGTFQNGPDVWHLFEDAT